MRTFFASLRIALLLACGSASAQTQIIPPNTESEYLRTVFAGTLIDSRSTPTRFIYTLSFVALKPLPEGSVLVFLYENPADPGGAMIEGSQSNISSDGKITVMSPGMECVDSNRYYRASVKLYANRERREVLSTHQQMVAFFTPLEMLETTKMQSCGQPDPLTTGDTKTAALAYLQSIIDHSPNMKTQWHLSEEFNRKQPLGFYYWGTYICEELNRGVPEAQLLQKLGETFRGDVSYAMAHAARANICPEPKN